MPSVDRSRCFNPRAHVGRDPPAPTLLMACGSFNPRAHVGRDLLLPLSISLLMFQSTRPRGTRPSVAFNAVFFFCFNPRAHVGRDLYVVRIKSRHGVSIHAPTWDATRSPSRDFVSPFVSIHAPTWDATHAQCSQAKRQEFQSTRPRGTRLILMPVLYVFICFNPRAHVGRDQKSCKKNVGTGVSIHAPTWDAT